MLESAGCRFIAAGIAPTFREMATVYWLLADKQAFRLALDSGDFDMALQAYADKLSPSVIPAAASNIKGILARSFAPASGGGKPMPTPTHNVQRRGLVAGPGGPAGQRVRLAAG